MKLPLFLFPLSALVISIIALNHQRQSISALGSRTVALEKALDAAEHNAGNRTRPATSTGRAGEAPETLAIKARWRKLLDLRNPAVGNALMPDPETIRRLTEMNAAELVTQLDEIDAQDLSEDEKVALEQLVGRFLTKKDPKEALLRLTHRLGKPEMGWMLNEALEKWLATDRSGAIQWLDRQINSGTFDTKTLREDNPTHSMMEKTVIQALLDKDPKIAGARLLNLPVRQQDVILGNLLWDIPPKSDQAFAEALRAGVPDRERAAMFERLTGRLDQMGLERIGTFLDHIGPTPEERAAITGKALADKIGSDFHDTLEEHVEKIRAWGTSHDPTVVDRATGEGLGEQAVDGDLDEISALLTKYQRESGKDDVLISFLKSFGAAKHPDESLALAGNLTDPDQKARFQKAFTELARKSEK